jgi:hypothetical protein
VRIEGSLALVAGAQAANTEILSRLANEVGEIQRLHLNGTRT